MTRAPAVFDADEAAALRDWIDRVGPDDGVLAAYSVSAPLSTRRVLWSYEIPINPPLGFPNLGPEFQWVFAPPHAVPAAVLERQGFAAMYRGPTITVWHRPGQGAPGAGGAFASGGAGVHFSSLTEKDIDRLAVAAPAIFALALVWLRLRRAWRTASTRRAAPFGIASGVIVADAPRDLADPARGVVRLSAATARADDDATQALCALESSHLDLALSGKPPSLWLARLRPWFLLSTRLAVSGAWLTIVVGLATNARIVLDAGGSLLAACVFARLLAVPWEKTAARHASRAFPHIPRATLDALAWRHVAACVPLAWRRVGESDGQTSV